MFIYAEEVFYIPICDSQYHKILKTRDYFQNVNINAVFLLIFFLILYAKQRLMFAPLPLQILNVYIYRIKLYIHI